MTANARIKKIWDLIKATDLGSAQNVYVVDSQNRVIAHPDPSVVLKTTYFTPPPTNGFYKGLNGDNVFLVTENIKLGSQILTVITEENATEALAPAITTVLIILVITVVASIIASFLGLVAAQQIAGPIQSLAHATHRISQGDLSQRVEVTSHDEIGELATAFDGMRLRLGETLENLEQRVNDRTRDLQLAVDVSRQITTVLNIHELMQQVVVQVGKGFNFYSTSVWLAQDDLLMLTAVAAEQGLLVPPTLADTLPLSTEPSIIALTARTRQVVNVSDVSQSLIFLQHKGLSQTRSELCIPMLLGDHLLGVFDIQSKQANRFGSDDVRVLTALAEQIAIAVRNAQLFAEAQAARQEAERANKVKSQFLASMSHELRTPLNAILNFSQFVATGVMGTVNDQQVNALNSVIASGKHLLNLINDVLDISKIESGTLKLYVQAGLKPNEILDWSGRMAESLLENKSVQLMMGVEEQMPDLVGDERRIRQIMLNLISNACKFTEQGSITIGAHQQGENILFYVRDTGPGIAPDDYEVVFETFHQTDTGLRHGGGTGLGLPISRKLAEAHGGRLWLESTLGVGTTFYVTLPIDSEILVSLNTAGQPLRKDKNAQ